MNSHDHDQQRGWVQQSLALSPSESERQNVYPRRVRIRCPSCGRPMVKSNGRLSCANANCTRTADDTDQLHLPLTTTHERTTP